MRIDVWSDIVCPWCYLGERRLEAAIGTLGWDDEVEVHLRAFQLDPSASAEPGELRPAIERKYGPGAFDAMVRRLTDAGGPVGIDFHFDRAQRVNTMDGHRLLAWAGTLDLGLQQALSARLFRAYFTDGENVADPSVLNRLATAAGLDADLAAEVVAGDDHRSTVQADLDEAEARAITAVPTFVVADRLAIPGAQDVETMATLLERAHDRL